MFSVINIITIHYEGLIMSRLKVHLYSVLDTHGCGLSLLLVLCIHFVYISAHFLEVSGTYRQSSTSGSNGGSVAVYTIEEIKV